jgi:hypothetical protein
MYWSPAGSGSGCSEVEAPLLGALLRLAASRVPSRSLCKPDLPSLILSSATMVLLSVPEIQGVNLLCQHLKILRPWAAREKVLLPASGSPPVSAEHGFCLVAPCGASEHRVSP